jgi:hypothetical protein
MDDPDTEIAGVEQIEPRLAWAMRLCQPYGELTRETLAARVCDLAGLPRDLSSEEVDAIVVCALMTQQCIIGTGAPPYWESAEIVDAITGHVSQQVPVEVGRSIARRMVDAGRAHPEELARAFWLAVGHLIWLAFVRPLVEAGFVKVWATERIGRPPTPPDL